MAPDGRRAPAPQNLPARQSALASGLEKVERMIEWGRLRFPIASEHLRHWRDGKGKERKLPASAFQSQDYVLEHLARSHRPRFVGGAERRLREKMIEAGRVFEMEWTDSMVAPYFTDLYFALGGFTVHSRVRAEVVGEPGAYRLRLHEWEVQIRDDYDWDPGKTTLIPGIGRVTDDEMLAMERAGHGMAFKVVSDWVTIADDDVTGEATITP